MSKQFKPWYLCMSIFTVITLAVVAMWLITFDVDSDSMDSWIQRHQEHHRQMHSANEISEIALSDERTDGSLYIQLWQFQLDGKLFYDTIVWKTSPLGTYRVIYEMMIPQTLIDDSYLSFGFQDGFFYYFYRANRDLQIAIPVRTFTLHTPITAWCLVFAVLLAWRFYHFQIRLRKKTDTEDKTC